jgi:hypothetical protein
LDSGLEAEIWRRLVRGAPVHDLRGSTQEGRVDLRGLAAPKPTAGATRRTDLADVTVMKDLTVVRGVKWEGLDFAGGDLSSLRLFDVRIDQCKYDGCRLRDWRIWGSSVANSSFVSADLRGSALGGIQDDRTNRYERVDWTGADLRDTAYAVAEFVDCDFAGAKLSKIDFGGSRFVRCRFSGELRGVTFSRTAWDAEHLPPNEMREVDFSEARLRCVEFRHLDLQSVRWPADDAHVLVPNYRKVLDLAVVRFVDQADPDSQGLAGFLDVYRKWAGQHQETGIFHREDLLQAGGEQASQQFLDLVAAASQQPERGRA